MDTMFLRQRLSLFFLSCLFLVLIHGQYQNETLTVQRELVVVIPTTLSTYNGIVTGVIPQSGTSMAWSINPPTVPPISSITLTFQILNINSAQLFISDSVGNTIFNCVQCGSQIPPSITTNVQGIVITLQGVAGSNFIPSQLGLQYLAVPSQIVPNTQWNRTFTTFYKNGYGHFTPSLVTGYLLGGSKQQWLIQLGNNVPIYMSISNFVFGTDNTKSRLQIFDNTVGGMKLFDGRVTADAPSYWIQSNTGTALIILTSPTGYDQQISFEMTYWADVSLFQCGSILNPDVLIGSSGVITDGSSTSGMRVTQSCGWLIKPSTIGTVTLFLDRVAIKTGGSVIVYDNRFGNGTVLWSGTVATYTDTYLSFITPPPLTSTGNSLFVVYTSNAYPSPALFRGFHGTYRSNYIGSVGIGSGQTVLSMSSAIDLTPPGDGKGRYTKGANHTWLVQPSYTIGPITFVFSSLELYGNDIITIYDGSNINNVLYRRVGGGAGNTPTAWITSSLSTAMVVFSSNVNTVTPTGIVSGNFRLSYYADGPNYHCGFPTNPGILTANSMTVSDGSPSNLNIYPGQNCQWLIKPSTVPSAIVLIFTRFSLFGGQVDVYNGPVTTGQLLFTLLLGNSVPPPITIASASIGLHYRSYTGAAYNQSKLLGPGNGFAASYYGLTTTSAALGNANGVMALYAAMMLSLTLVPISAVTTVSTNVALGQSQTVNTVFGVSPITTPSNVTWLIQPLGTTGSLYLALSYIYLPCTVAYLDIHDGTSLGSPLIGRYCGSTIYTIDTTGIFLTQTQPKVYSWITTTGPAATLNYVKFNNAAGGGAGTGITPPNNNFELSYYGNGPAYHCGFVSNPATLTAPSMIVTDGGGVMLPGQNCQWLINPYGYTFPSANAQTGTYAGTSLGATTGGQRTIFLEFVSTNMVGGTIEVFEGTNSTGTLLWQCISCSILARPIVSSSTALFLRYTTTAGGSTPKGSGFSAVYWTVTKTVNDWRTKTNGEPISGLMLENPPNAGFNGGLGNVSLAWHLSATTSPSELVIHPRYTNTPATWNTALLDTVVDGRPTASSTFESYIDTSSRLTCGVVVVRGGTLFGGIPPPPTLQGNAMGANQQQYTIQAAATQYNTAYLTSTIAQKQLFSVQGSISSATPIPTALFQPAGTCKYFVNSGSRYSVLLTIASFQNTAINPARLRIYGGITGYDSNALMYDSTWGGSVSSLNLLAPCGKALIIVETNGTLTNQAPNYFLDFSYQLNSAEDGNVCGNYISTLVHGPPPKPINILYIIIPCGAAGLVFISLCAYCTYRHFPTQYFRWYYQGKIQKLTAMATFHPPFTPKLDAMRNKYFLKDGECCICGENPIKVLRVPRCNHGLCLEDLKAYVESALGDIAQFPLKCPMHYEGCESHVEASTAKRVLNRLQYDKFLEFSDRSTLGEGMRCIYCSNYVNFPSDHNSTMVSCPYCVKRFCMMCRKAWHADGTRCPLEKLDDSLEKWKSEIGAQKCPSCLKLIEKDDPNTCNHMVHKITDGIPCVHERTDFCYLCGEAVTQDYPHDEVNHPGINHFPEGVFQKCRVILAKEREEEREQLRHMRRNRIRNAQRARRGRRDQQVEGEGVEDSRQVATDVEWTGDVLPGAPQESDPTTGIQLVPSTVPDRRSFPPPDAAEVAAANGIQQPGQGAATGRALRRTNRGQALPPAHAPVAVLESIPVAGVSAALTLDLLQQHNETVPPLPEGGRLMAAFDAQWNTVQFGGHDPGGPNFEEEW